MISMRYVKYIVALFAFALVSCGTKEDFLLPVDKSSESVQIVARIMPFADRDVTTKTPKDPEEAKPHTTILAVFNSENECVLYRKSATGETIFALDRGSADNPGDFSDELQSTLTDCDIYLIANFPEIYNDDSLGEGKSLTDFASKANKVQGITMPESGLPMLGACTNVDLSRTSSIDGSIPLIAEMRSLYAKVVFHIEVDAKQSLDNKEKPQFRLDTWEVHNVVKSVDNVPGTESLPGQNYGTDDDTELIMQGTSSKVFSRNTEGNNTAQSGIGNSSIDFEFYLPERYLRAETAANDYPYPFRQSNNSIREEDKRLMQRYKPVLAKETATFVRLNGVFRNHQEHSFDVSYDIYLGNDNYGNFDIVRNARYYNEITIRDIENSNDSDGQSVSIDHRVDVQHVKPIVIKLRRETLLDSHFEVRPMRLYANADYFSSSDHSIPEGFAVKVEVLNEIGGTTNIPNWVRLERSFGGSTVEAVKTSPYLNDNDESIYITDAASSSYGKRRYFTENLVSGVGVGTYSIVDGTEVIIPISSAFEDCVWIYIDEVENTAANIAKDKTRNALIRVTYGTQSGDSFTPLADPAPVDYFISQSLLYPVATTRSEWTSGADFDQTYTYLIEYEEEYLYNFDSEDTFTANPTFDDGMEWGLNGIQFSTTNPAAAMNHSSLGTLGGILEGIGISIVQPAKDAFKNSGLEPKYDFYLSRDKDVMLERNAFDENTMKYYDFKGYEFSNKIVAVLKTPENKAKEGTKLDYSLDQSPESAVAYCYNKNKRNANGEVVNIKWYLPSIDEIEDIMETDYLAFNGVFQKNFYWSCQPAFDMKSLEINISVPILGDIGDLQGDYYDDDLDRARATRVEYKGKDQDGVEVYETASSGVSDYTGVQNGALAHNWRKWNYTKGTYVANGILDYSSHPGNKPRKNAGKESWARVRCVYQH